MVETPYLQQLKKAYGVETFGLLTSTSTTPPAHKYSPFQFKIELFCYQQFLAVFGVMEWGLHNCCRAALK